MSRTEYFTLIAVALVEIVMSAALFIYLGNRIDQVIKKLQIASSGKFVGD